MVRINLRLPVTGITSTPLPPRVSQKPLAGSGSAAFQAAGVAEAPIREYRLALPPVGTHGSRQDAGGSQGVWGEGT